MKIRKVMTVTTLAVLALSTAACSNQSSVSSTAVAKQHKIKQHAKYYSQISDQVWWIKNGAEKIYGHIYQPVKFSGKKKVAILSHGLGGNYEQMTAYARNLAHRGYFAYAYDFPGGSLGGQSTGRKSTKMSIFTEERDLLAVIRAIRKRKNIQPKKFLLVGASQGGVVSALTASNHPRYIGALALMYPAFSITANAQHAYSSFAAVPKKVDLYGFTLGRPYFKELFHMDITKTATRFNGPVLIVHGQQDEIAPLRYSRQAAHNFKHAQLKILPNAGHDFAGNDRQQAIRDMDNFVNELR